MSGMRRITLTLTPTEAALVWNLADAQADAGACEGGNTPLETTTLQSVMGKLLPYHPRFRERLKALSEGSR